MPTIRHEINIINSVAGPGGVVLGENGYAEIDPTKYAGVNNTLTWYFEVRSANASGSATTTLREFGTTTDVATLDTSSPGLHRVEFTPNASSTVYGIYSADTVIAIWQARVICIQKASAITATRVQINVGQSHSANSTTGTAGSRPLYWRYNASLWTGASITVSLRGTFKTGSSKSASSIKLQVADGTGDGFAGWTDVTNTTVSTISTTFVSVVSTGAVTLTDARNYRVLYTSGTSKSSMVARCADILIDITNPKAVEEQYLLNNALVSGGTGFQNALTSWDSAEWVGVSNSYVACADAANGSTSVVTIQEADGGSTLGTVTSPDNQGFGTAIVDMPTTQNLDAKLTTNNSDVYATRLLVRCKLGVANDAYGNLLDPHMVRQAVNRAATY